MGDEDRIADLEAKVADLIEALADRDRRIAGLEAAEIADLVETLADRDKRIAELEKLLSESHRASKRQAAPFSKGAPSTDPKRPGRKGGAAHGRHAHRSVPPAATRELEAPAPACCPDCEGRIAHDRWEDQWQVDLPDLTPTVTRFKVAVGRCTDCGRRVQGHHPEQTSDALGAAASQVGPAAKAWAVWLHYGLGLSFAKCSQLLARLGVNVTAGALVQAAAKAGTDLVPVRHGILERVNAAPAVVMDETGWKVNGVSSWLWVATTATGCTVYNVADGRGFDQACEMVDADYDGVVVRDGWAPYRRYDHAEHQTCTAHLLRRCHELMQDLPDWARSTPRMIRDVLLDGLEARDLDPMERAAAAVDLAERIELLAEQPQVHDENRKLVKHLTNEAGALFTYLTVDGVDATNWRGEQAIRPAVVNRKVSGGNRTWNGAGTQSTLMSVIRTAAQQGVDIIDYLVAYARAPDPAATPLFP